MGFKSLIKTITFGDVTAIEQRSDKSIVTINGDKRYAISAKRLAVSTCDDDVELFISKDGKWLIPADSVLDTEVDW